MASLTGPAQTPGDAHDRLATAGEKPGLGLPELGEKVLGLLRERKVDLTAEDTEVMRQVAGFVTEQEERPPPAGPADDTWRRSLMTVGHDPLRA